MASTLAKIQDIEDEMARTQKNKATAGHLGLLKAKLAKLRREILEPKGGGGGGGSGGSGFDVSKAGDARVGLVGFPSVGKSTLLQKLTGTFSEVCVDIDCCIWDCVSIYREFVCRYFRSRSAYDESSDHRQS